MLYVATQSMAVRRLMRGKEKGRKGKEEFSWSRLLSQVAACGPLLTVDGLGAIARDQGISEMIIESESQWIADNWFVGGIFRSDLVESDRNALFKRSKAVLSLADNQIAHLNPQKASTLRPTFDDLDLAIDLLSDVTYRYRRLLRGVDLDPTNIGMESGWTNVFERPLFKSAWANPKSTY